MNGYIKYLLPLFAARNQITEFGILVCFTAHESYIMQADIVLFFLSTHVVHPWFVSIRVKLHICFVRRGYVEF